MEGPDLRSFPRTLFSCPVELSVGEKTIRLEQALGNLSMHGLFIQTEPLPVDSAVHIRIVAAHPAEFDGVVRFCDAEGIHIEFLAVTEAGRLRLYDLIAELVPKQRLSA
jgi:hypothetical protein